MLLETLLLLFNRDLNRLRSEVELYQKEENLWKIEGSIANSAGNLCLHLIGNLNTYIGKEIGNTAYIRNREAEFSLKNIPCKELVSNIDNTLEVVKSSVNALDESMLASD